VIEGPVLTAAVVEQMNVGLLVVDEQLRIAHWNRFLEIHSGRKAGDLLGQVIFDAFPDVNRPWLERKLRSVFLLRNFSFTSWRERPYLFRFDVNRPATGGSSVMRQDCTFIAVRDPEGAVKHVAVVLVDATEGFLAQQALDASMAELRHTHAQLQREVAERQTMEVELRNAHRLEAVEHLAAGVAHEVNTPLQVLASINALVREAVDASFALVARYQELLRAAGAPADEVARAEEEAELEFWREELPRAVQRLDSNHARVSRIISTLKGFAGDNGRVRREVDVNAVIQEALRFAAPMYENVADIELDLGPVPALHSPVGALGQVFLSLITNAAQAIARCGPRPERPGKIEIRTSVDGGEVVVAISDNGDGIPEDIRPKVFDLFFTTSDVGRGLGAGLALAYATVAKEHRGRLRFTSELGQGTSFYVHLPLGAERARPANDGGELAPPSLS
jgi:two-component system NtrC family sensor kinase